MFKLILIALAFMAGAALIDDFSKSAERVEKARYEAQRTESQDAILSALLALNDPAVSEFASDWRKAYPQPSPAALSELRDIEQRIKNDKTAAVKMTHAYKMKNSPFCNGAVKAALPFSTTPVCKPGI